MTSFQQPQTIRSTSPDVVEYLCQDPLGDFQVNQGSIFFDSADNDQNYFSDWYVVTKHLIQA